MNALDKIIAQRDEKKYQKVKSRMMIAAKIADAMKERGITQKQLASMLGKKPSEISRLLTGNHNFSHDTLFDIQQAIGVKLLCAESETRGNTAWFGNKTRAEITVKPGNRTGMSGLSRFAPYGQIAKLKTNTLSTLN